VVSGAVASANAVRRITLLVAIVSAVLSCGNTSPAWAQGGPRGPLPELTAPVNDFANVIDSASESQIDRLSRALQAASGDVVVVATIDTFEPYADIRDYAVELFENHGRGVGQKGQDNGLLVLLSLKERRVWVEVGYGLEEWITDGFAGQVSREAMVPHFRNNNYGAGLLAGTGQIVGRIAEGRGVTLQNVELPAVRRRTSGTTIPLPVVLFIFILIWMLSGRLGGPRRGARRWGRRGWSGWSSGVGTFGGGFGGRGGGFGGGFGGFGGGRSGGGGGGAGW
jgi:uncharacterized protein